MLQSLLNVLLPWRWFAKKEAVVTAPVTPPPSGVPSVNHYRDRAYYRNAYYRRGNNFYSVDGDSLVDDLVLLTLLMNAFDDEVYADEMIDEVSVGDDIPVLENVVEVESSIETDIAAIDAAEEAVREKISEPAWVEPEPYVPEPEPSRSYSDYSSSYDSGSSSYDSGGDSGGGSSD